MNNQPQDNGPLEHVKRPTSPRSRRAEKVSSNRRKHVDSAIQGTKSKGMVKFWTAVIVIAIVAVAMVPIIHSQLSKQNKNLAEKEIRSSQTSHSKSTSSSHSSKKQVKKSVTTKAKSSSQTNTNANQGQYSQATQNSQSTANTVNTQANTNTQANNYGSNNNTKSVKSRKAVNGSYTVQAGDSLSEIAAENNTTVEKLQELNGLSGDTLASGQSLKVK